MQQLALTVPLSRPLVLGGLAVALALGAGAAARAMTCDGTTHRLTLHAADAPNAYYVTVFENGDVNARFPEGPLPTFTRTVIAEVSDGCRWRIDEQFVPRDAASFDYDYRETLLSCRPGATPTKATPRKGIVTVVEK